MTTVEPVRAEGIDRGEVAAGIDTDPGEVSDGTYWQVVRHDSYRVAHP